jgi:hypothetical protein
MLVISDQIHNPSLKLYLLRVKIVSGIQYEYNLLPTGRLCLTVLIFTGGNKLQNTDSIIEKHSKYIFPIDHSWFLRCIDYHLTPT